MRDAVLDFAAALTRAAATEDAFADELAVLSREATFRGALDFGAVFLRVARAHRTAAIRHRAQCGALLHHHGMRREDVDGR